MGLKWDKVLKWLRDNIPNAGYHEARPEVAPAVTKLRRGKVNSRLRQ